MCIIIIYYISTFPFEDVKTTTNNVSLSFYLKTKGQISGGTWASFLNSIVNPKSATFPSSGKKIKSRKIFYSKRFKRWALLFPVIDKYIVLKTIKSLNEHHKGISFKQYMLQKSFFSMMMLVGAIFFIAIIGKIKLVKNNLLKLIPSGTGPSIEKRKNNWFEITIIAKVITNKNSGIVGAGLFR